MGWKIARFVRIPISGVRQTHEPYHPWSRVGAPDGVEMERLAKYRSCNIKKDKTLEHKTFSIEISGVAWISPEYLQERGLTGVNLGDIDETKLHGTPEI